MKREDLRIGNWYMSTKFQTPVMCDITDLFNICANCEGAVLDDEIVGWTFQPMQLTEAYIELLGFIKLGGYYEVAYNKDSTWYVVRVLFHQKGYEVILRVNTDRDEAVVGLGFYNFVHELQNLYHGLNGEELERIKPNTIEKN